MAVNLCSTPHLPATVDCLSKLVNWGVNCQVCFSVLVQVDLTEEDGTQGIVSQGERYVSNNSFLISTKYRYVEA